MGRGARVPPVVERSVSRPRPGTSITQDASDSTCYMDGSAELVARLRAEAASADELHRRSRAQLVGAVRTGAAAGLSQREIAEAIGRSQPEVSRLLRFHGRSELGRRLGANRSSVVRIAGDHGARNVRVFGSVARGTDDDRSDVDLLVDLDEGTGLFSLARLEVELAELLGTHVDVVPARSLRSNVADQVLSEAVPL